MHIAVVEFARNVANLEGAHSSEIDPNTPHPVIDLMPEQKNVDGLGGTMRLGRYLCKLEKGTKVYAAYGECEISERHRHRYEFNNEYLQILGDAGLVIAGKSPDGKLVEIVEYNANPWFVGVQFHPEFKSRPNRAHPLFKDFVGAAIKNSRTQC